MRLHAPSHHLAAEQVNDRSQVQPALVGGDIGDVTRPNLIGGCRGEVALYQVRRNGQMVLAVRGDDKLALASGTDEVLLHQAAYPLFADPMSTRHQFLPHLGPAVFPFDFCMDGADVRQ